MTQEFEVGDFIGLDGGDKGFVYENWQGELYVVFTAEDGGYTAQSLHALGGKLEKLRIAGEGEVVVKVDDLNLASWGCEDEESYGIDHHKLAVRAAKAQAAIKPVVNHCEEPELFGAVVKLSDPISPYYTAQSAALYDRDMDDRPMWQTEDGYPIYWKTLKGRYNTIELVFAGVASE